MENANSILFWERRPPSASPDLQALQLILNNSGLGVLVLSTKNEVLFSTSYLTSICANNHFKTKFISIFKYETAEGSPDTIVIKSDGNGAIEINSSFIHWNGEKAALFIVKELPIQEPSAKRDEALHIAMHLTESFQLPILFFKNDLLIAANLRAVELLSIDSAEYNKTNFTHLFDKVKDSPSANAVEHLLDAVTIKAVMRSDKSRKQVNLISRNIALDGQTFKMVQILAEEHADKTQQPAIAGAHDVMMMASHDLREPVRTIVNYAQLTLDKLKNGKYKQAFEYADLANTTALRMDKLLSDLKLLVSIQEQSLETQKVNLQSIINAAIADVEKTYEKGAFSLSIHKMPEVAGNEKLLIQLFKQLLDNAIKFKKGDKATIEIAAEQDSDGTLICVRDNGIGIPRKYKDKIFEPFQRLNRIDEYPGSGLGLAIVKKIAEKHNGRIYVESMEGVGAAVYLHLPL